MSSAFTYRYKKHTLSLIKIGLLVTALISPLTFSEVIKKKGSDSFQQEMLKHSPLSIYGKMLQDRIVQKNSELLPQLMYLNTDFPPISKDEIEIKEQLSDNAILLLDGTTSSEQAMRRMSVMLGGIGFSSPIVIIRTTRNAPPEYKQIVLAGHKYDQESGEHHFSQNDLNQLADESYRLLSTWKTRLTPEKKRYKAVQPTWRPEISLTIELRQIGLPCMVGSKFEVRQDRGYDWAEGKIDACHNVASLSLFYTIDLIRSTATSDGGSLDAKYFRITVDPETGGGVGWHLIDKPAHKHTWFGSWSNRETWFGPIADNYQIWVHSLDPEIHLHHSVPKSSPKYTKIAERTTLKIGLTRQSDFQYPSMNETDADTDVYYDAPESFDDVYYDAQESLKNDLPEKNSNDEMASKNSDDGLETFYDLSPEAKDQYLHYLSDPVVIDKIYYMWDEIISESNLSSELKHDLLIKIMLEINGNISHLNANAVLEKIAYWQIGLAPQNAPLILAEFEKNPIFFSNRPQFSRPYTFVEPRFPQAEIDLSSDISDWGVSYFKASKQNRHTMRTMMPNSSLTYSSERSIHYNNYEYTLYNRSKAGLVDYAAWEWSRDYDTNSKLWRNHKTCPLWCQDWFFNDNNFSPASYANFNPGFSATFFAPANKKGSSSFRLSASMRPVALGGRVQHRVLFQQYKPWGQSGDTINVDQLLTVNWDSQVFMLVTPVCLQMRHKDLCLNVREGDISGNAQVNLYKCRLLKSQLWYMDSSHRLMSQSTTERCLTQGESGKVQLQNCTIADNQKWYWNKDRLGNSHGCYLSYQNNGTIAISCDSDQAIEWSFQIKKPDLSDSLTTQIL